MIKSALQSCKVDAVKHHRSHRNADCGVKVDKAIYADSSIAKAVTCGKTKAENWLSVSWMRCFCDPTALSQIIYCLCFDKGKDHLLTLCFTDDY